MKKWYAGLSPEEKTIVREKNNAAKRAWKAKLAPEKVEEIKTFERHRYDTDEGMKRKIASRSLFNRVGITLKQKEELFESQRSKCASCGATEPGTKVGWHTDHDHKTKFIRGVLCHKCNMLLGFFEKQADRIELVKAYLNFKPNFHFEVI